VSKIIIKFSLPNRFSFFQNNSLSAKLGYFHPYTELQPSHFATWFLNKMCFLSHFRHSNRALFLFMTHLYQYIVLGPIYLHTSSQKKWKSNFVKLFRTEIIDIIYENNGQKWCSYCGIEESQGLSLFVMNQTI